MKSSIVSSDTNSYFWILLLAINAHGKFQMKYLIYSKMVAVLIFYHVYWFWQKTTLGKLVAMATKKRLSLIYELENFADTYLGKVI